MTDTREHPPPATAPVAATAAARPGRVVGLDGIRALAALYVVAFHIFLRAWPGYPGASHAPFWATLLSYGQGAVALFIVLSGFSLGLARRARSGAAVDGPCAQAEPGASYAMLGGARDSLVMTWYVVAQPGQPVPTGEVRRGVRRSVDDLPGGCPQPGVLKSIAIKASSTSCCRCCCSSGG